MWTIEKITRIDDFIALSSQWDHCLEQTPEQVLYVSADFIRAEWEHLGWESPAPPAATPFVLVIRENDEIVGLFPLIKESTRAWLWPMTVLRTLGSRYLDRSDMIMTRNAPEVVERVLQFLAQEEPGWNVLWLQNAVQGSTLIKEAAARSRSYGFRLATVESQQSPYIEKSGPWDRYFSSRSKNFHKRLKNKSNGLAKTAGPVVAREYASPEEAAEALQTAFAIDSRSWKAAQGTALSSTAASKAFWQTLTRYLAEKDRVRIWILWARDQAIAFEYHVLYGRRVYSMKWSYDAAFQRFSPGLLLRCRSLESFWQQDIREIDLLGVSDDFKEQWTDKTRNHENVYLFNHTLKAGLIYRLLYLPWRGLAKSKHAVQKTAQALSAKWLSRKNPPRS